MGWNTWNTFQSGINENLIKESAEAFVSQGLRDAGYEYVVIDDCWSEKNATKTNVSSPTTKSSREE